MEEKEMFGSRMELSDLKDAAENIRSGIRQIIVGQDKLVKLLIAAILADGHVLIEGVPGVAKTLAAKLLARTLNVDFSRIQFTPDLMPSDVLGTSIFNMKSSSFEFNRGPIFSNVVLIDEINRAPAKTQSALFEVMEERQVTVDGNTYQMDEPFIALATQNPIEQEGTYQLPEAQLDRFLFKIEVGYPSLEEEQLILSEFHARKGVNDLKVVKPVLTKSKIKTLRDKVKAINIEQDLINYITAITHQTRNDGALFLGASPRASLAIMRAAKAMAGLAGRDFVTPEDVREVTPSVLRHRLLLTPEKEMEGVSTDTVIQQIVDRVEVPR